MTKKIRVYSSQIRREKPIKITSLPKNKIEFEEIVKHFPEKELIKRGFCIWDKTPKGTHYLYPMEWYDIIPVGYPIENILNEKSKFKKGETDDDIRFGCLCFGFIREKK